MKKETKEKIKKLVLDFANKLSVKKRDFTIEELKKAFPFHALFFADDAIIAFKLQRSIVTTLGMKIYPEIARIIAKDNYEKVYIDHPIEGKISEEKANVIERIITNLRQGRIKPDFEKEKAKIKNATGGNLVKRKIIADIFIQDHEDGPLFMEIKSPRPNLDVCAESKKKMLYFRAFFENKNPQAFIGFPYNPFVHKNKYAHNFVFQIFDFDKEVLLGEEMWDKLGGNGTFAELLNLLEELKEEIKRILR
ncbi:MAG: TdeIII family type II restriction endonuclease [Candidatus Desulfofervidus auxilii]|nr:TdeIII family type II restriction endonuclease [Candidatus Desulfofervidus auxilii]